MGSRIDEISCRSHFPDTTNLVLVTQAFQYPTLPTPGQYIMNTLWMDFLRARGARFNQSLCSDFGAPLDELRATGRDTIIVPLSHLAVLRFSGDDAKTFLHNQVTSDINHLDADGVQLAGWCSAKGRMLASFQIFRDADGYCGILSADLAEMSQTGMKKYVLRSRVTIENQADRYSLIGLSGNDSQSLLASASLPFPSATGRTVAFAHGSVIRLADERIVICCDNPEEVWSALATKARQVSTASWQWLDVQAGLPLIVAATREAFVPQMVDFDKIGGVNFHKGCYPGQEVVARAHYLGKVKRHLYRVHAEAEMTPGTPLFSPDNPDHACGEIANVAPSPAGGFDGLAVIQENFAEATDLGLGAIDGPGFTVTPIEYA